MTFDWDEAKAEANLTKHGVAFDEAKTVFGDPFSDAFDDPDHSHDEERLVIIGATRAGKLLFVSFAERGDPIRIISAREATHREKQQHENQP